MKLRVLYVGNPCVQCEIVNAQNLTSGRAVHCTQSVHDVQTRVQVQVPNGDGLC